MKRCGNCGKYPFCNHTAGANDYCDYWLQKEITKLDKKDGDYYKFSKLEVTEDDN